MSWHNNIFGYRLRTIVTENPKKLRTASLNSEFTGSYNVPFFDETLAYYA